MRDETPGSMEGKLAKLDQAVKNWEASAEELLEDNKRLNALLERADRERSDAYDKIIWLREELKVAKTATKTANTRLVTFIVLCAGIAVLVVTYLAAAL